MDLACSSYYCGAGMIVCLPRSFYIDNLEPFCKHSLFFCLFIYVFKHLFIPIWTRGSLFLLRVIIAHDYSFGCSDGSSLDTGSSFGERPFPFDVSILFVFCFVGAPLYCHHEMPQAHLVCSTSAAPALECAISPVGLPGHFKFPR